MPDETFRVPGAVKIEHRAKKARSPVDFFITAVI